MSSDANLSLFDCFNYFYLLQISDKFKVDEYVVKAQILAGGRGLGHFSNGFKGGVHITKDPNKVLPIVAKMVGNRLITKQTPKDGIEVKKVMIAESVDITRETYFSILMDRGWNGPVIIASPAGGTDIEKVGHEFSFGEIYSMKEVKL